MTQEIKKDYCLVLMAEDTELFDMVIEPTIKKNSLEVIKNVSDIKNISKLILEAKLIIAILDDNNMDMVYALALSHIANKKVIFMKEEKQPNPFKKFDIGFLDYSYNDLRKAYHELYECIKRGDGCNHFKNIFPDFEIRTLDEKKELEYLRETRKKLIINVTPSECSIFFNNRFLGKSPQTIYVNPHLKNIVSVAGLVHFEHYQILTNEDLEKRELNIKLKLRIRGEQDHLIRVNKWFILRRSDPDSPVLSSAIAKYLRDKKDYETAREEIEFCIFKAPNWYFGKNILGDIEYHSNYLIEAKQKYEEVKILEPHNYVSYYNLARVFAKEKKKDKVLIYIKKILETKELRNSYRSIFNSAKVNLLKQEKVFDFLRDDKEFQEIEKEFDRLLNEEEKLIEKESPNIKKFEDRGELEFAIKQLKIENFQSIKEAEVKEIPIDSNFIFLVGYNGYGKTSILQALSIAINGNEYSIDKKTTNPYDKSNFKVDVELKYGDEAIINHIYYQNEKWNKPIKKLDKFATYGACRLSITSSESMSQMEEILNPIIHIFERETSLLNIEHFIKEQKLEALKSQDSKKESFIKEITTVLKNLMPDIDEIEIDGKDIFYYEKGDRLKANQLSNGHLSIVAMFGDMIIRLYEGNSEKEKIADYSGIVLIDEFETHLHPKMQYELPKRLYEFFPKVQFWVATHSALPFSGSPRNSTILRVDRDEIKGTTIEKLDIDVTTLLPNTILTSPIFKLDELTNRDIKNSNDLRTEHSYQEIEKNNKLFEDIVSKSVKVSEEFDDLLDEI